ncbi:glycosyltransferase family 2 protein [Patescibacteria group bacterium]
MSDIELSIIILNYRTKGLLKQCIRGIEQSQVSITHEVIVVDNKSGDSSVSMVKSNFDNVRLIEADKNRGYAAGNNIGIKEARGKFILIINPDIAIFKGAVEAMVSYMNNNEKVAVIGPKLINPDGSTQISCYRFPTYMTPIYRRTPIGKLPKAKKNLKQYLMSDWHRNENKQVDWVLGACMLVRKSAIDKVGLMDERYFLYFEDIDWCRRFWKEGYQVHYLADVDLVHYHQRQSAESPGFKGVFSWATRVHIASAIKYFAKYLGEKEPKINDNVEK